MPTSQNAKVIDLVLYSQDGKRYLRIRVKTLSKRNAIPLGKNQEKIMGDFWVIVRLDGGKKQGVPVSYILTPEEVCNRARSHKGDWFLEVKDYELPKFEEAWSRIGLGFGDGEAG